MKEELRRQARLVVDSCVAYRTRRLNRVITRLYNDRLAGVGVNVAEMNLLAAIAANPRVKASDLSRAMEIEKSTMSRNLARLEARGWVSTKPNHEGRGELVNLTETGQAMLWQAIPAWQQAQEGAMEIADSFASTLTGKGDDKVS